MVLYVAQRVVWIFTTLVVLSVLIFAITQMLPGSVAQIIAGQFATPDTIAAISAKLGLNDPYYLQYWRWASSVLHGDFGRSLIMERTATFAISNSKAATRPPPCAGRSCW